MFIHSPFTSPDGMWVRLSPLHICFFFFAHKQHSFVVVLPGEQTLKLCQLDMSMGLIHHHLRSHDNRCKQISAALSSEVWNTRGCFTVSINSSIKDSVIRWQHNRLYLQLKCWSLVYTKLKVVTQTLCKEMISTITVLFFFFDLLYYA